MNPTNATLMDAKTSGKFVLRADFAASVTEYSPLTGRFCAIYELNITSTNAIYHKCIRVSYDPSGITISDSTPIAQLPLPSDYASFSTSSLRVLTVVDRAMDSALYGMTYSNASNSKAYAILSQIDMIRTISGDFSGEVVNFFHYPVLGPTVSSLYAFF